jgi:predicted ArsR family transcriptional regulator
VGGNWAFLLKQVKIQMKFTVQQFADKVKVDKQECYGFLRFLEARGVVKDAGTVRPPSGKGKGTKIYEITPETAPHITDMLSDLAK